MQKTISSDKYQSLVTWLKDARLNKDLSMRDLAELIDTPHSFIGKIETSERRLDVYEYVVYCKALGLDPKTGLALLE
jgi:transcriptional regulator with XRE-family HTH domain